MNQDVIIAISGQNQCTMRRQFDGELNFVGCQVFQAGGYGFCLYGDGGSNLISSCRTFQIEKDTVRIEDSNELNISSNIFCWNRGHGIVFKNAGCVTISSNEVIDSGVCTRDSSLINAIQLENKTRSIQIPGNAIFNFGDQCSMNNGIVEDESWTNNNVVENTINYMTDDELKITGKSLVGRYNLGEPKNCVS